MTSNKRSSAVPLTLVPALAALVGCNSGPATVSGGAIVSGYQTQRAIRFGLGFTF